MKFESTKEELKFQFPDYLDINFHVVLKQNSVKGRLVYEYNPFYNYRINDTKYEYNGLLYSKKELDDINVSIDGLEKYDKDMLTEFDTKQLNFDLKHPVEIDVQDSYDGTTNIILNDNYNIPRLINNRFSQTGFDTYEVVDRLGSNDTNIYDEGNQFETDTSLYKRINEIPKLTFENILNYGNLQVGNYNFYFKFSDADGNETDFVAESSIVSIYSGAVNDTRNIKGGLRDENAYKTVNFRLSNIDTAYDYITVYYTRSTSDIDGNPVTTAHKILQRYIVKNDVASITINGFENTEQISIDDINISYNIVDRVKTQAVCNNMLFLGNVNKPEIPYQDLADCALRMYPKVIKNNSIGDLDHNYVERDYTGINNTCMYYNPKNIYYRLGYWNDIYRVGVVFIMPDNTLSPVFNIRGYDGINSNESEFGLNGDKWTKIKFNKLNSSGELERNFITFNESDFKIYSDDEYRVSTHENAKGVIRLAENDLDSNTVIGLNISFDEEVLNHLKTITKGFFFVRQKRIPSVLGQALTIGLEKESRLPVLPVSTQKYEKIINKYNYGFNKEELLKSDHCYAIERFINNDKILTQDYEERLMLLREIDVEYGAAICPEINVENHKFKHLLTGSDYIIKESDVSPTNNYLMVDNSNERHYYVDSYKMNNNRLFSKSPLTYVDDNVSRITSKGTNYSSKAGTAEEGFRFSYIREKSNKNKSATNMVRGSFGPYLGMNYRESLKLIDIYIPGYNAENMSDYFKIRYEDESPYYAISERISINDIPTESFKTDIHRGDCFICNYTQRINRNFQDLSAPNNDIIVDEKTWKDNYNIDKKEKFVDINTGDVNAIKLGQWLTFRVRSSVNLSLRTTDPYQPNEEALTGTQRHFYPYKEMSVDGNYKIPEAYILNGGHNKLLSEKYNFIVPNVPHIKNKFNTRILYSNIHINDAFENGFRVFRETNYRDYPKTFGSLVKLISVGGFLLAIFEHGVCTLPVNERIMAAQGQGGSVYINTTNVLPEKPVIISDTFGSQWADSVIKTPGGIYGVDTIAKKIWHTDGQNFTIISDFKIQKFIIDNITLSEKDKEPLIGIRNVKTLYNAYKRDVMFTFYDNLTGSDEKAFNICWNEYMQKWVTNYSWIPTHMNNINNIPFSFDRNTSKTLCRLGRSKSNTNNSSGITLKNPIFFKDSLKSEIILENRLLPVDVEYDIDYEILCDVKEGCENFEILTSCSKVGNSPTITKKELSFIGTYEDFIKQDTWDISIKCNIMFKKENIDNPKLIEYISGWENYSNSSSYSNIITVSSFKVINDNTKLTTDFWKHGQAGIIDIKDDIKPCFWYGKQHPFEFEFVVVDNPQTHKIFENLKIVSNNVEPESFHYRIVGDVYSFSDRKESQYYRQEALKSFYKFHGSDILYDKEFYKYKPTQDKIEYYGRKSLNNKKSIMFPLYYGRFEKSNQIHDSYEHWNQDVLLDDAYIKYKGSSEMGLNYDNLSGTEIIKNNSTGEFEYLIHDLARNIDNPAYGRLRGNLNYQDDCWDIQINSINFVERNELDWRTETSKINDNTIIKQYPPLSIINFPKPKDIEEFNININDDISTYMPKDLASLGYTYKDIDNNYWYQGRKEAKIRDKFIRIRVRYTGNKLSIITALKTFYNL